MKSSLLPPIEDTELVLEELFRHTPVGVVLSDLHGTILDVNDALCAMIGYERAELVGHTMLEVSHPDDLADVRSRTADLREGRAGHYVVQRRYISRRGDVVHAKVSVSIVYSKTLEPVCGIGFLEDITDRVKMESALRESELRYRRVVEDQTELIVRCLPDGTRTFVNQAYARYNLTTRDELLGTSFFTCMEENEQRLVRAKFAALTPSNPVITDQHWVVGPSGDKRWHEWTDRGFFDDAGTLIEIQSVGRDLTEQHEARQQLVESEERYRRLFNSLPIAVWENDWSKVTQELARRGLTSAEKMVEAVAADSTLYSELGSTVKVTTANPAALAMAGVTTLTGFDMWLATAATPETALRFSAIVPQLVFGDRKSAIGEYTLVRETGEPIDVLIHVTRSDRHGGCSMLTIAVDVTDRKRIQRELEYKQELTERTEAATHLGSWQWMPATETIYGSAEFWRIMDGRDGGGPPERPTADCIALLDPERVATGVAFWKSLQEPTSEERPPVIDIDYHLRRPDGSVTIANSRMFAIYASDGSMTRAFGILRDITDVRRAEEEIRHKQELTDRAEAAANLGTWEWTGGADDMLYGSDGFWRIFDGPDGGHAHERPLQEILARMHPDDAALAGAEWFRLRAPGTGDRPPVLNHEYRIFRGDGSLVIARARNFAMYGPDGALTHAFGILWDVTEARRAEAEAARHRDELVRADKMISLGILVSGVTHEINNPNHAIGLNVPLLREAWRDASSLLDELAANRDDLRVGRMPWIEARSEVASMLGDIEHASERIRNIVTELRGFALDQEPGARRKVPVNEIVKSSLRLLGKHIARATKDFRLALAEDVPPISGNPRQLEQVVVNLVLNACQALENDEQAIRIATGVEDGRVFIRVRDEGRGIAPEHLPNIRTPFFTTKRAEGGTGLGVPVSDRIAGEHGGELTFESESGRGTTATLWLPAAES